MVLALVKSKGLVQIIIQEEAKAVRDAFCKYFSSKEGEVPWQWHAYAVDVNKR